MAELWTTLAFSIATLLIGVWGGHRRGARRAWEAAQDKLSASEDERGQLVEELDRANRKLDWVSVSRIRHRDRVRRVREDLTQDDCGHDLPPDAPLTVGQVLAVLDGDATQLTKQEASDA